MGNLLLKQRGSVVWAVGRERAKRVVVQARREEYRMLMVRSQVPGRFTRDSAEVVRYERLIGILYVVAFA